MPSTVAAWSSSPPPLKALMVGTSFGVARAFRARGVALQCVAAWSPSQRARCCWPSLAPLKV
eukprot:2747089-Lingulodinium_polyedra.AAC.1